MTDALHALSCAAQLYWHRPASAAAAAAACADRAAAAACAAACVAVRLALFTVF